MLCIPPAEPPHVCRDSTPQHSNPGQNSHHIKAGRARPVCRIQEELLRSPCLLPALCQGPAAKPGGPGKWPQAGSAELLPKAQLKCNAHFICLFIYLLLTGKCNTKANYLIKALGRVLMSQTSKQISKPLFCLRLQSGGCWVGAGRGGTEPFSRAAAACSAMVRGGSARGQVC